MSITRETLELAALAAGHDVACTEAAFHGTDDPINLYGGGLLLCGLQDPWRPHLDDGDAARLAVAVGMKITAPKHCGDGASAEPLDGNSRSVTVYRKDKAEQMRVAIVLCAAAVGERMRGER